MPTPPTGPGPAAPLSAVYTDLPSELSGGWQMVDGCIRQLQLIVKHPDFLKMPNLVAVFYSLIKTLKEMLSTYTSKGSPGGAPMSVAPESSEPPGGRPETHFTSADADVQPESGDSGNA